MKAATVRELKQELSQRTPKEVLEICLRLSKFKQENKELLTYLLFEAGDEASYVRSVKQEIDEQFAQINTRSYYLIKKSVRKVLRAVRKYIRYSSSKETEVELLIYFCIKLRDLEPSIFRYTMLRNLYERLVDSIEKKLLKLHEDLQYDYGVQLEDLR